MAAGLNFPDKRRAAMLIKIPLDELKRRLLFMRERNAGQRDSKANRIRVISTRRYYYPFVGESMEGFRKKYNNWKLTAAPGQPQQPPYPAAAGSTPDKAAR